ncbi:sensor histidine kinase [Flavobacterium nitratireducens]|uniref:sensor histidine kinase n=1 Tax=Flavobacterium nitratireducens TaxID=992289 RepID=UPI0024156A79|nr:sensor histidine kinase [Flavobacterium nitratireducens]
MSKLENILALVRSINQDEFQEQITYGDSLDDVYEELLFLSKKIESKKQRTAVIVEQISNCFAGDFFNYLPISYAHDELDVFCMGFNTYIEELKAAMVSQKLLENLQEKLVVEKDRSEQLILNRDHFLTYIGREIRESLLTISKVTNSISKNTLDHNSVNQLEYSKLVTDVLLITINDLLDLAKVKSSHFIAANKPFGLDQLINFLNISFSEKCIQKEIDFKVTIDSELPNILNGDCIRVSQVLWNSISNAVKYTPVGGKIRLKIQLEFESDEEYVLRFIVIDSGVGISDDKLKVILQGFAQQDGDLLNDNGSSILVLAICKKVVDLLNGEIKVKSKLQIGTKFTFTLPFNK